MNRLIFLIFCLNIVNFSLAQNKYEFYLGAYYPFSPLVNLTESNTDADYKRLTDSLVVYDYFSNSRLRSYTYSGKPGIEARVRHNIKINSDWTFNLGLAFRNFSYTYDLNNELNTRGMLIKSDTLYSVITPFNSLDSAVFDAIPFSFDNEFKISLLKIPFGFSYNFSKTLSVYTSFSIGFTVLQKTMSNNFELVNTERINGKNVRYYKTSRDYSNSNYYKNPLADISIGLQYKIFHMLYIDASFSKENIDLIQSNENDFLSSFLLQGQGGRVPSTPFGFHLGLTYKI